MVGMAWYVVDDFHYEPIRLLEGQVAALEATTKVQEITINNLGVEIVQLTENNRIIGFEEYFKVYFYANTTVIDNDKLIF